MIRTISKRLKLIQQKLGVEADGVLGTQTLTALENVLDIAPQDTDKIPALKNKLGLILSQKGIDKIIGFEIGSKSYYQKYLRHPCWPGAGSGITIGIGYDLGYQDKIQFSREWQNYLNQSTINALLPACGLKGQAAKNKLAEFANISISYQAAMQVFIQTTLISYAARTKKIYPDMIHLYPDAQAALVSLVYNRGDSLADKDSRREMRDLVSYVKDQDYEAIARSLQRMKRLWGANLSGLLKRRDVEANLILTSHRPYKEEELFQV